MKAVRGISRLNTQISFGIILSYGVIIVNLITGLLYTPLVLSSLGQSQYGIYTLCTSLTSYLTILNAGLNAAFIKYNVQYSTQKSSETNNLNGFFFCVYCIVSILSFVIALLLAQFSPQLLGEKIVPAEYKLIKKCLLILSFETLLIIFNGFFSSVVLANERFVFAKLLNLIVAVFTPVITIPFLINHYDCTCILIVKLFMASAVLITNAFYALKRIKIRIQFGTIGSEISREIGFFVFFITLQCIMDILNWQVDKYILARTHGPNEISIYSVGSYFNSVMISISAAISSVFIARINVRVANNDFSGLNKLFIRITRISTCVVLFIMSAYTFFGEQFILAWAGIEYKESFRIGWLLMFPIVFTLFFSLGQDIARAENKHHILILLNFAACVGNVFISIPLAARYGATGCAFGTFLCEVMICVIIQPLYYKWVLKLDMKEAFANIISLCKGLALPLLLGVLVRTCDIVKPSFVSIGITCLIYFLVYSMSIYSFSCNYEEKYFIKSFIHKQS